jgi:acetylornithine deacetylase/succinyl-diaminopimelate desuccinylase-like protein
LKIADVLGQVDGERIYQHVLRIHGARHPIDASEKLNETADYIHLEFERYGLVSCDQTFTVPGFEGSFRNLEAAGNNKDEPELLVVAHYDTVENCPGANDNGSGVAVMLEAARVLAR